ncbi:MAG TPA: AI-2E family transporter [Candidatus Binataceae bacterium]
MKTDQVNSEAKRPARVEVWIGAAVAALLAFGCLLILRPFISAALWALILCFTTWPLFQRLESVGGGRRTLAASIATLVLAAFVVAPVAILVASLSRNVTEVIAASQRLIHEGPPPLPSWVASIPVVGSHISAYWTDINESSSARLAEIAKLLPSAEKFVLGSGRALVQGIFQIALSLLLVFFFYRDGQTVAQRLAATINRIGGDEGSHLLDVAGSTMRAVVYGILGTALVQGVLAAIGFMIAGVPGAVLLGFLTFVLSPFPGGPILVALPAAFWLYREDSLGWAIFMVVWGVMVGSIDSLLRPVLISRAGGTTPLILVMLGVLGGAMAFGLIGLFLGPTLLAVGYSLFEAWSSTRPQSEH